MNLASSQSEREFKAVIRNNRSQTSIQIEWKGLCWVWYSRKSRGHLCVRGAINISQGGALNWTTRSLRKSEGINSKDWCWTVIVVDFCACQLGIGCHCIWVRPTCHCYHECVSVNSLPSSWNAISQKNILTSGQVCIDFKLRRSCTQPRTRVNWRVRLQAYRYLGRVKCTLRRGRCRHCPNTLSLKVYNGGQACRGWWNINAVRSQILKGCDVQSAI